ncbi:hypothetical protein BH23VER1_BH23VER1_13020 [soil metagenome]
MSPHFTRIAPVVAAIVVASATPGVQAQNFISRLFNDDLKEAPSSSELQAQEAAAAQMVREAQAAESAGNAGRARKTYEKVVKEYPLTNSAGIAQFRAGALLEEEGKISSAFEAYQRFVDSYRQSAQFGEALQRQYDIAQSAKDGQKVRWLGIPRKLDTSRIVEMFESVIKNAPRTELARQSQFAIGEVYEENKDISLATAAYQKLVDDFPESAEAGKAQLAIAEMNFGEVERGTHDGGRVQRARESAEDFLLVNPEGEERGSAMEILEQLDATDAKEAYEVAKFYEKQGNLKAAAIYYSEILKAPASEFFPEARERLADIAAEEPEAVRKAPDVAIARNDLVVPAESDVKNRADYLGPPAPATRRLADRPKMRATGGAPLFPVEEPDLPIQPLDDFDLTLPIDGQDLLLPPPPPPPPGSGVDDPGMDADEPADELLLPELPDFPNAPEAPAPPEASEVPDAPEPPDSPDASDEMELPEVPAEEESDS